VRLAHYFEVDNSRVNRYGHGGIRP
jgi:hypothetical protein